MRKCPRSFLYFSPRVTKNIVNTILSREIFFCSGAGPRGKISTSREKEEKSSIKVYEKCKQSFFLRTTLHNIKWKWPFLSWETQQTININFGGLPAEGKKKNSHVFICALSLFLPAGKKDETKWKKWSSNLMYVWTEEFWLWLKFWTET